MHQEKRPTSPGRGQSKGSNRGRLQKTRAHKVRTRVCLQISCNTDRMSSFISQSILLNFTIYAQFQFCRGIDLFLLCSVCNPTFHKRSQICHRLGCVFQERVKKKKKSPIEHKTMKDMSISNLCQSLLPSVLLQVRLRRSHRCDYCVSTVLLPLTKAFFEVVV